MVFKVELPDGLEHNKYVFQTKDLDCLLNDYVIDEDGRFMVKRITKEPIPESERQGLFPLFRTVKEEYEDTVFHGKFNFYVLSSKDLWHEYVAFFSYGKLDGIKVFNAMDALKKSRTE